MAEITETTFADARECYRNKNLRLALYDAGEMDASTTRPYFGRYPVIFSGSWRAPSEPIPG